MRFQITCSGRQAFPLLLEKSKSPAHERRFAVAQTIINHTGARHFGVVVTLIGRANAEVSTPDAETVFAVNSGCAAFGART